MHEVSTQVEYSRTNVLEFIVKLQEVYGTKFDRLHRTVLEQGKPSTIWSETVGKYPQAIANKVLRKITFGETNFNGIVPTIPQLVQLLRDTDQEVKKQFSQEADSRPLGKQYAEAIGELNHAKRMINYFEPDNTEAGVWKNYLLKARAKLLGLGGSSTFLCCHCHENLGSLSSGGGQWACGECAHLSIPGLSKKYTD